MTKEHIPGTRKPITREGRERLHTFRKMLKLRNLSTSKIVDMLMKDGILTLTEKTKNVRTFEAFVKDWVARERDPYSVPQGKISQKIFTYLIDHFGINILEHGGRKNGSN